MGSGAEEALTALARDLVEEISAGRALEIAEDGELELASFNVKPFHRLQKTKTGRIIPEEVRGHVEMRQDLQHPGNLRDLGGEHFVKGEPGHMIHNTSNSKWAAGQKEWEERRGKDIDKLTGDIDTTSSRMFPGKWSTGGHHKDKNPAADLWHHDGRDQDPEDSDAARDAGVTHDAYEHLSQAQRRLKESPGEEGKIDQTALADAYHHLHEAHRIGVERVLPRAQVQSKNLNDPKIVKNVHEHLDLIQKHMEKLDEMAGVKPQFTRKLLGSSGEQNERAADIRDQAHATAEDAVEKGASLSFHKALADNLITEDESKTLKERLGQVLQDMEAQGIPPPAGPAPLRGAAAIYPEVGTRLVAPRGSTIGQRELLGRALPGPAAVAETPEGRALVKANTRLDKYAQRFSDQRAGLLKDHLDALKAVEAERAGQPRPGEYQPLTDEQYALHAKMVEERVNKALQDGKATSAKYSFDGGYNWFPERALQHKQIINDYLDKQTQVPSAKQALVMGGLGGAGKSTTLKQVPDINLKDFAVINPDDFKTELARRGMVPEVQGLAPLEAAALVHDESSFLADQAAQILLERGKNVAYDITMSSTAGTSRRLDTLRKAGYDIHGVFVDIPVEMSVSRALNRHRAGLEAWRKGETEKVGGEERPVLGGRYVPPDIIRAQEMYPGVTRNREAFEELKPQFADWQLWDNSGRRPQLVDRSQPAASPAIASVEELRKALDQPSALKDYRSFDKSAKSAAELAVGQYSDFGESINRALRGDTRMPANLQAANEEAVPILDRMMSQAKPLAQELEVWRGTPGQSQRNAGDTWTNPHFTSTSVSRDVAEQGFKRGAEGQLLRITIPKGSRALVLNNPSAVNSQEHEVLLPRNAQFRATSVEPNGVVNVVYTGATEAQARAAELGTNSKGGAP